jgi:hypothetical protein
MNYGFVVQLVDPLTKKPEWEGSADDLLAANDGDEEVRDTLDLLNTKEAGETLLCGFFWLLRVD